LTWLLGSKLGRYALLFGLGVAVVVATILFLDNRAKRLAAVEVLQAALRAAQARKDAQDEVNGMSRVDRDDALSKWMRKSD
jgi:hypothetical protein